MPTESSVPIASVALPAVPPHTVRRRTERPDAFLSFTQVAVHGARVIAVRGHVDLASAPRLQVALHRAGTLPGRLALDLSDADVGEDEGAVLMLNALRRLERSGRAPTVVCPPGPLRDVLESSGLARRVRLVDDRAALESALARAEAPAEPACSDDGRATAGTVSAFARRMRSTTPVRRGALLAEATLVLEQRHGEHALNLAEVARQIATSGRQLQRVFAELAGSSFRDELTAVRMQHAARLLRTTELPVGTIAPRVGYRQAAQFAKAFRRHHGQSPSAFRMASRGSA
jgi:AraC family transcriptional regulator of adaptative response / methylphosphotriester-DNA alkyltransferase methyltransferase